LSRRAVELVFVTTVAIVEAVVAGLLIAKSHQESNGVVTGVIAISAGLSFVVSGLIALHRRPENKTGLYLAAVGYLWLLGSLTAANSSAVFTVGQWIGGLAFVPFAALLLSFPTGRLERSSRTIVRLTAVYVVFGPIILLFDKRVPGCGDSCPDSAAVVWNQPALAHAIEIVDAVIPVALCAAAVVILVRRWRAATTPARRLLLPVYAAGGATLVLLLVGNAVGPLAPGVDGVIGPIFVLLFTAVPYAFLFGILRSKLARGSVAGLMLELQRGRPLRAALAEALGDPSLGLAFWLERQGRWVDLEGRTLDLSHVPAAAITVVEHDGVRVGALLHDESLANEPDLVAGVAAGAAFALDNERLKAELRAQNEFLTTMVDTAPSLLVTVDTEGRIRTLNPATLEASGHDDPADVLGRHFWDIFIDQDERQAMQARFRAAAPDHAPAEYENVFTNARGGRLSIIWRGAPVRGESGQVEQIVAAGLDVTERRRQEQEIRASRGRIVTAGDMERRRLERNLHDGAQQRLVALSLALRLAQSKLETDPSAAGAILAGASDELARALEELRELARGIHPAVLTDRGLDAALEGLASRSPVPVELMPVGRRLPGPIEAAAYYVVSEAIANVVKHAGASSVRVGLEAVNGSFLIDVVDDGRGGADVAGSGLRGLADRIEALDGRLVVESPADGGTRVCAQIPLVTEIPLAHAASSE
jgi:PAS domain S-box-containing protein